MSARLSLELASQIEDLPRLVEAVESMSEQEGWAPDFSFHVQLALEELVVNVMSYAYDDEESHGIEVTLVSEDDALTIDIVDEGLPFDPLHDAPEPDIDAGVEERRVGGLGIFLVQKMMDEVRYRRDGDRNRLTLVKRRGE